MRIEDGLQYTKDHEWVKVDGETAYVGITDYAQDHLGDIVFIELPETGVDLKAGDVIAVADSVKAASDIYTPVAGKVTKVNETLAETPEKINEEPYETWIAQLKIEDALSDDLMDAAAYRAFCDEGE